MATGTIGTFVISWAQTEVDGYAAPSVDLVAVGAAWRWTGEAVRIDLPGTALVLEGAAAMEDLQRRAARTVGRLLGQALLPGRRRAPESLIDEAAADETPAQGFVLTDGRHSYAASVVRVPDSPSLLVVFAGRIPPAGPDLWVVRCALDAQALAAPPRAPGGVICFTPGTLIATPDGPRPIEALRPGDRIDTADNGPQPVLWTGRRHMTGARLHALPHLRPVRIRAAALGDGRPDRTLLVSPQHRMLLRGAAARALYGTPEVLVAAADLVDDAGVTIDLTARDVTYVHVLLEAHQIVFANGIETESFHPLSADPATLEPGARDELLALLPGIEADPAAYGAFARRPLTAPEAAILRRDAA
jgi:hypothetical protein